MEVIQELNINVTITDLESEQERSSVRQDEVSRETNSLSEVTEINTSTPAESSQIPVPIDNTNINSPLGSEEEVHTFNNRPEESPPPYTSGPNPLQYSQRFGGECSLPGYNDISNRSSFGQSTDQQLYLLNQQGQMVPVHLPGQIVYGNTDTLRSNEQIMSTNGRSTVVSLRTIISLAASGRSNSLHFNLRLCIGIFIFIYTYREYLICLSSNLYKSLLVFLDDNCDQQPSNEYPTHHKIENSKE